MVIKHLNQLVCVTFVLCCAQAYRSYLNAQATATPVKKLTIINGTNWNMNVRYTTPSDAIAAETILQNGNKTITIGKDTTPISYSLAKESVITETRPVPLKDVQGGTFQLTPDMIKELIAPFTAPPVVVAPVVVAPAALGAHPATAPVATVVTPALTGVVPASAVPAMKS